MSGLELGRQLSLVLIFCCLVHVVEGNYVRGSFSRDNKIRQKRSESGFLENLEDASINAIRIRLEEEKAKRLLIQNDLEVLMVKFEQLQRTVKGLSGTSIPNANGKISFTAQVPEGAVSLATGQVLVFDYVINNQGSGYNSSNGVFVVPVSGTYMFSLSVVSSNRHAHLKIMADETAIGYVFAGDPTTTWGDSASVTITVYVETGTRVYVQQNRPDACEVYGNRYTSFSGALIYAA